ncbi:MAG: ski2-like helicase, partial [Nocardioides sp.]|nr:ski2-like helicase [Nocardioides sp.]
REMYEQGMSFTDFVGRYQLARSEGLVLRYLTDAYRTLRQTVPEAHRTPELEDLVEWLGETVRQTDSSLLDEWEALTDPESVHRVAADLAAHRPPPPPRPISQQERPFRVMVRNAMFRRVEMVARDDLDGLMKLERAAADRLEPAREVVMTRSAWDTAIEDYFTEHETLNTGSDARGPRLLIVEPATGEPPGAPEDTVARLWRVRQVLDDPEGHHDWVIDAVADLDASDEAGELVLATVAMRRL